MGNAIAWAISVKLMARSGRGRALLDSAIQRPGNLSEINHQIIVNIHFDNRIKGILDIQHIFLEIIHSHRLSAMIHNPILANPAFL